MNIITYLSIDKECSMIRLINTIILSNMSRNYDATLLISIVRSQKIKIDRNFQFGAVIPKDFDKTYRNNITIYRDCLCIRIVVVVCFNYDTNKKHQTDRNLPGIKNFTQSEISGHKNTLMLDYDSLTSFFIRPYSICIDCYCTIHAMHCMYKNTEWNIEHS